MKKTYVAVSTTNYQTLGMKVYAIAESKDAAESEAQQRIVKTHGPLRQECGTNIYTDTLLKNLQVVSKSEAIRRGWLSRNESSVLDEETNSFRASK